MKTKLVKIITIAIAGSWLAATSSMAAITATSDDFSSATSTNGWLDIGSSPATIVYDSDSASDYDNLDLIDSTGDPLDGDGIVGNLIGDTEATGDGAQGDGGLLIDTQNGTVGDEAIGLTIAGTMEESEQITYSGGLYNDNTSYTDVNVQLWNLTDGTLLTESGAIRVKNYNNSSYAPVIFSLNYTAVASDDGDTLQIRFRDAGTADARDVFVDNFSVTSVPPDPSVHVITWDFNSDSGELTNDVSDWDYTSRQGYNAGAAAADTLAFSGKSGSTDYWIVDKGTGHEKSLLFRTINTLTANFGIYMKKLDFTVNNMNSTNQTKVSWSFDILGTDEPDIIPTNWTVKINYGNTRTDLELTDAAYGTGNSATAQTFDFVDDDSTWTTISGSYMIAAGQAGTAGGIQISTDNGGYTSGEGIVLDNIQITIESIDAAPDTTSLVWNFDNDGPTGTVLTNNLAKYDYTRDTEYAVSNAAINTLAFNGKSSGTDYIIRDKGGEHSRALYLKTIDTDASDFGIYIQKLDMTAGGRSVSNTTRVSWSFDILGYDSNGDLNPSNWTVKVMSHNQDTGLNVSDAWYSSSALAQTFNFVDDSTGETATNGTWTTISGSYDIAVGATGTVGGVQISTDGGNYTSAGGIFLDNIAVTIESISYDSAYSAWAATWGVDIGSATNDYEPDGLDNFAEYVFGGDPTDGTDIGTQPSFDGGDYIFSIIGDDTLQYYVLTNLNLVIGTWGTNDGPTTITDNDGSLHAFTNLIGTTENELFIKLLVE